MNFTYGGFMKITKFASAIGLSSVLLISSMSFTGCTPKITDEQLARLQELRKQERQINSDIANKQNEITKIEGEIRARQSELTDCNKDKDFIIQKLAQWPNVWPDYDPSK
jgi:peptidoglycan hydrolase CwlO-like protein